MRIFGFAFLITVFLANTIIVSAWAKQCMNGAMTNSQSSLEMTMMDHSDMDMPCEDMQQNQNDEQHCDGVCLCLHVSTHQYPTLANISVSTPIKSSISHDFMNDQFTAITSPTLKRPPRA